MLQASYEERHNRKFFFHLEICIDLKHKVAASLSFPCFQPQNTAYDNFEILLHLIVTHCSDRVFVTYLSRLISFT